MIKSKILEKILDNYSLDTWLALVTLTALRPLWLRLIRISEKNENSEKKIVKFEEAKFFGLTRIRVQYLLGPGQVAHEETGESLTVEFS